MLGHYAELDGFFGPDAVAELQKTLDELGKEADLHVHAGADHAFFNDTRPEVYNEAEANKAWSETVAFLRAKLA